MTKKKPTPPPKQSSLTKVIGGFRTVPKQYLYAGASVLVLLVSTIIWSYLGARTHESNADQLIDAFLFQDWSTFHNALFPGAHTFLIKWPLFLLLHLCGSTPAAFVAATVLLSVSTVVGLAYILYKIDSRPLVWGTLLLAMSSLFVLVPAQPYAGGLLPVNMAMVATRNIEYLVYIVSLCMLLRWNHPRHVGFWAGISLLGILIASDHLFITIALGGAILGVVAHAAIKRHKPSRLFVMWLAAAIGATGLSMVVVWGINTSGLTHISSGAGGPFTLVTHPKDIILGIIFGILGIFTNLGANPAFDAAEFKHIPQLVQERLLSASGPSYIINAVLLMGGLFAVWRIWLRSITRQAVDKAVASVKVKAAKAKTSKLKKPAKKKSKAAQIKAATITKAAAVLQLTRPELLTVALLWSSVAACIAFVVTDHYYVVDSRYLSVVAFTLIIAAGTYLRTKTFPPQWLYVTGLILFCSTALGFVSATHTYRAEQTALKPYKDRTTLIVEALERRSVTTVVGDYWRVLPLKLKNPALHVVPYDGCGQPREILSTAQWRVDLKQRSFAYIQSFDKGLTNYPGCSVEQLIKVHGRPSSSLLIEGQPDQPAELLVYYMRAKPASKKPVSSPARAKKPAPSANIILPSELQEYPYAHCEDGRTILNIVAHEDDDLLFTSPDLLRTIREGSCVRTVYMTAGDAGSGSLYWLSRERGSEAAYDTMLSSSVPWTQRTLKTTTGQFFTISNPRGNHKVSLMYMHMPDGNIKGQGFAASNNESLARLVAGDIGSIRTVDGQSEYTLEQIETMLNAVISHFNPSEIRTQAASNHSSRYIDHSDHMAVGQIVSRTYERFTLSDHIALRQYVGYPVLDQQHNVTDQDFLDKMAAFMAYAKHDTAVCQSESQCDEGTSYGGFVRRQFTTDLY